MLERLDVLLRHAWSSIARTCDGDEVAEHALAGELQSGAGADDRHLSDRLGSAYDRVGGAVDSRQRVGGGKQHWLHASVDVAGSVRLGELERCDVTNASACGQRLVDLGPTDTGDPAANDLLGAQLSAEDKTGKDHRLGHRIRAVDVSFHATLGEAGGLCFRERIFVGPAL